MTMKIRRLLHFALNWKFILKKKITGNPGRDVESLGVKTFGCGFVAARIPTNENRKNANENETSQKNVSALAAKAGRRNKKIYRRRHES